MSNFQSFIKPFFILWLLAACIGWQSTVMAQPAEQPVSSQAVQGEKVNINTASAQQLAAVLVGVGETKAQAIVAWREANGAFTAKEQLLEVKGIGQATLDKNNGRIEL